MRLIDADTIPYCNYDLDNYHSFRAVEDDVIADMPTIDAEPVVRCKDCKHRPTTTDGCLYGIEVEFPEEGICPFNCDDPYYNQMPEDDFFCAKGERRSE